MINVFYTYLVKTFLKILWWRFLVPCSEHLLVSGATLLFKTQNILTLSMLETLVQVFSCEFYGIFKNTFFTEHLQTTASVLVKPCLNSDLYFISKTSRTALLVRIVSYKPLPNHSQENRKTLPSSLQDSSTTWHP